MNKKRSIFTALVTGSCLLTFVPLILMGIVVLELLSNNAYDEVIKDEKVLVKRFEAEIRSTLRESTALLKHLALNLQDYESGHKRDMELDRFMDEVLNVDYSYESLLLLDSKGMVVSAGLPEELKARRIDFIGMDMSALPSFKVDGKKYDIEWSDIHHSIISGRLAITISMQVDDSVLIGTLGLSQLYDDVNLSLGDDETGYVSFVLDQKGTVIFHNDKAIIDNRYNFHHLKFLNDPNYSSKKEFHFDFLEEEYIACFSKIKETNWSIIVARKAFEIEDLVKTVRSIFLAILICAVLVALLVSYFFASRIARPLLALRSQFDELAQGKILANEISEVRYLELSSLLKSFAKMSSSLSERENELRLSQKRYQELFSCGSDAVFIHPILHEGEDRGFDDVNDVACRLLGYAREELLSLKSSSVFSVLDTNASSLMTAELLEKGKVLYEELLKHKNGSLISVEIHARIFELDGKKRVISSARDITRRKAVESELKLEKDKAENANNAKSEFLAVMSHELRTPMNAVLGFAQLIRLSDDPEQTEYYIDKLENSGELMVQLIDRILSYIQMSNRHQDLIFELGYLHEELSYVESFIEAQQQRLQNKLEITTEFSGEKNELCNYDKFKLRQVFNNLISNAIKFTDSGSINISMSSYKLENTKCKFRFAVKDSGIGISADGLRYIWDPFSQVDSSIRRNYDGAGLGLAISKKIIDMMEGKIWCESTLGKGSQFIFEVEFDVKEPWTAATDAISKFPGFNHPNLKVICAEDNQENQDLIKEMFKSLNIRADIVDDGLKMIQAIQSNHYDLALVDLQMPVMDGLTAVKNIREGMAGEKAQNMALVALSAHTGDSIQKQCLEAGVNLFLEKPVSLKDLIAVVSGKLEGL